MDSQTHLQLTSKPITAKLGVFTKLILSVGMAAMFLLSIGLWPRTSTWLDWGLAFGLFLLLPGYLPSLLLFPKGQLDGFQRVALSFPMSLGIALVPTLIVLATRSTLPTLGLLLFLVNLLLFLLVLKRWSPGPRSPMRSQPHLLHTLAIAVVIFVAVWVTWVGIQDGPIDGDDWRYLTRIRHYQDSPHLDDKRSYGIEQATVNPRQYYSIWLPLMAFLSKTTQIEADVVWLEYLRLTLVILGVLSFYTLARSILGSSVAGAFACAVQILYVLSEISRHEGIGRLFFIRLPQDKVLDWLVILPICFFALLHYLETKDRRFWVVFALSTLALSNISIIGIVLIGIPSASFIFVRVFLEERDKAAFQSYLLVGIVLLLSMVLPLISRGVLGEVSGSAYRREFRLLALSDRLYISNPDLLCNLFTLAALVLSPLLIIEVRAKGLRTTFPVGRCRDGNTSFRENSFISAKTAAQFLLVATFSSVLLVFNPLVAPILGRLITRDLLWRVLWILPATLVICFLLVRSSTVRWRPLSSRHSQFMLASLLVAATIVVLLNPIRSSIHELAGVDRPKSHIHFLKGLRRSVPVSGVILDYLDKGFQTAALLPNTQLIATNDWGVYRRKGLEYLNEVIAARREAVQQFYGGAPIISLHHVATLQEYQADYVIIDSSKPLAGSMAQLPSLFSLAYADRGFACYQVRLENLKSPADIAAINGDVFLNQGRWEEAYDNYQAALADSSPLAHSGLGRYYLRKGEFDQAVQEFSAARALNPGDVVAFKGLGQAYYQQWQSQRAFDVFRQLATLTPSDIDVYFYLAKLSERLGSPSQLYWERYLDLVSQAGKPISQSSVELAQRRIQQVTTHDLINHLKNAQVVSSLEPEQAVHPASSAIDDLTLDAVFLHPTSSVSYSLTLPKGKTLLEWSSGVALAVSRLGKGDGVQFDVYLGSAGVQNHIFSEYIDPKNIAAERRWHYHQVDLSPWAGQGITLTLATDPGPNGNDHFDWALWGEPRIVQPIVYEFISELPNATHGGASGQKVLQDTLIIDDEQRPIVFQQPSPEVTDALHLMQSDERDLMGEACAKFTSYDDSSKEFLSKVAPQGPTASTLACASLHRQFALGN